MRYFALSAFTSLAFGIFCSAAPTPSGLPAINLPPVAVAARDTTVPPEDAPTLQSVLAAATEAVGPLADETSKFHTVPPVEDLVLSILGQVIVILETAVDGLEKLASTPVKDSLDGTVTGVQMDVGEIVQQIVPLLEGVVTLVQDVLTCVDETVVADVLPLVKQITVLLAQILSAVLVLVGDLATQVIEGVVAAIQGLIPTIVNLSAGELLAIIGVSV
jgi:phage-related protein